jgi:hypothetical protein
MRRWLDTTSQVGGNVFLLGLSLLAGNYRRRG